MSTPKSIQIPYSAFAQLIKICEEMKIAIDIYSINFGYYSDLEDVLRLLHTKQMALERRNAYSKLVVANKEGSLDEQIEARINYLSKRGPKRQSN